MKSKKIAITITIALFVVTLTALSGCIGPYAIKTLGWNHINEGGTAVRIWGSLTLSESLENWNEGFVWDIESHKNWEDYAHQVWADNYDAFQTFSADIGGLDRTTEYHYRAFGENLKSSNVYRVGGDIAFIPGSPRVSTHNASNIGTTSAQLNGELWHLGGAATCEVFFEYGEDEQYLNLETEHQTLSSKGEFSATITGLESCTTYYFRSVAINDVDTHVGVKFKVTPGKPVVITHQPIKVGATNVTFQGLLKHLGGTPTCELWFEYGHQNPNNLDESTPPQTVDTTGIFNAEATGLLPDTTYWVRIIADNGICQSKGEIEEFKTLPIAQKTHRNLKLRSIISTIVHNKWDAKIEQLNDWLKNPYNTPFENLQEQYPQYIRSLHNILNRYNK